MRDSLQGRVTIDTDVDLTIPKTRAQMYLLCEKRNLFKGICQTPPEYYDMRWIELMDEGDEE